MAAYIPLTVKPHKCAQYNTVFSQVGDLKRHMMSHGGEKPHKCVQCNKSFSRADDLRTHLLTHTGEKLHKCEQLQQIIKQCWKFEDSSPNSQLHKCAECKKSFCQAGNLRNHLLTHSGEKPHKCNQCSHATTTAQNLTFHIMCSSAHNATMQLHQLETSEIASNRVNWFIVAVSSAPNIL